MFVGVLIDAFLFLALAMLMVLHVFLKDYYVTTILIRDINRQQWRYHFFDSCFPNADNDDANDQKDGWQNDDDDDGQKLSKKRLFTLQFLMMSLYKTLLQVLVVGLIDNSGATIAFDSCFPAVSNADNDDSNDQKNSWHNDQW